MTREAHPPRPKFASEISARVTVFAHRNVTPTDNSLQKCVHLPPEMMGSYLALETKLSLGFTSVSSEYRFTCALNHSAKRGFPDLESTKPKPQPSLRRGDKIDKLLLCAMGVDNCIYSLVFVANTKKWFKPV
jgi:hypothetical protein